MSKKWDWRIAYCWELDHFGGDGIPPQYAVREHEEFETLLDDGWEPVTGWIGTSALRSHVILRKKLN